MTVYTLEGVDESITEKALCIGMKDLNDFVCLQVQKSNDDELGVGDSPEQSPTERDGLPGYAEIFEPILSSQGAIGYDNSTPHIMFAKKG